MIDYDKLKAESDELISQYSPAMFRYFSARILGVLKSQQAAIDELRAKLAEAVNNASHYASKSAELRDKLAEALDQALPLFDQCVAEELPRVSHVEYDSHEICKHFAGKVRDRIAVILTNTKESS